MAKVIRTEQLSIDGDKIRLTADNGNLIVNSVDGDSITPVVSTDEIGSDISSLAVTDTQTNSDISSLAVTDTQTNSDISSLAALNTTVNSTLTDFSAYNVYSLQTSTLSTGPGSNSQTITLSNRAFISKPNITAILQTNADDPIIAVSVSNVVETSTSGVYEATFQFSDELPATGESNQATNYRLNILAAVNAADQDLDTIVDPVDSDRDGDGVENSSDYDPDDSSVGTYNSSFDVINAFLWYAENKPSNFPNGSSQNIDGESSHSEPLPAFGVTVDDNYDIWNYADNLSTTSAPSSGFGTVSNGIRLSESDAIPFAITNHDGDTVTGTIRDVYKQTFLGVSVGIFHPNAFGSDRTSTIGISKDNLSIEVDL